jgi:hypothetical protein
MITVIDEDVARPLPAEPAGDDLWIAARDLGAAGWERPPAGLCRGELCVPVPPGAEHDLVRADGAVNLAALARRRAQAVVHDDERRVWLFGTPAETVGRPRLSLEAPDFTLPDLDGNLHSLAEQRGRKVVLASWASW